jgi:hypothetical protein
MIPSQTFQVFLGAVVALLYAAAVMAIGVVCLTGFIIGREDAAAVRARISLLGFVWLSFIIGQGILGLVWLVLSLGGMLRAELVGILCALGWVFGFLAILRFKYHSAEIFRLIRGNFSSLLHSQPWYLCVAVGVIVVSLLGGLIALQPTMTDDALWVYLTVAKVIGVSHTLAFQPFATPHNALYPLQVEMHWAALFAISNETAVTVWDYLCGLSFLCGIGFISWSLTSSRRVALLAVLMMLSTPGFHDLMGSGKVDNAAAQYGLGAFLALVLYPVLRRRSIILAGLYVGWAMAARYTNVILLPALMVFGVIVIRRFWKASVEVRAKGQLKTPWVTYALVGGLSVAVSGVPMLIKNWLLVGCPLAPQFGCQDTFWATIYHSPRQNISGFDLLLYPFVWTFGAREDMLGNISPFFLGFLPLFLAYYRLPMVRHSLLAGLAGLVSVTMWLLIEPFILFTRWLLVPLGLLAVPLSASAVAVEQDLRHGRTARWLIRSSIFLILFFLLFQSRAAVYAFRYLASIDTRAAKYESVPHFGYDVAAWLNSHVQTGQRVALGAWSGHPYFVSPNHLLNSESAEELQWLWTHCRCRSPAVWTADFWHFYARNGFTYVIVAKDSVVEAVSVWSNDLEGERPQVAFVGRNNMVLRLEQNNFGRHELSKTQ